MKKIEVKICGVTRVDDAVAAMEAGADYVGMVFYPKSKRNVTISQAAKIVQAVRHRIKAIGVFVNAEPDSILKTINNCGLWAAQLHGEELAGNFQNFPCPIWRAIRVGHGQVIPNPKDWQPERYVIDSLVQNQFGGTGIPADWQESEMLARKYPIMLGGGLTEKNVADAVRLVKPQGVDVSSGVEDEPGLKNPEKIRRFIEAVRGAIA